MKYVFIALFMAFCKVSSFMKMLTFFVERVLRLYNSKSQIEKNCMSIEFAYQTSCPSRSLL